MDPSVGTKEDPLIAALPPATDYITYLTLLEYQLNSANLSTLNRLLSEDDGTLAAEIGWDLLKLVLPMLQIVPEEANKCLNIIARRGNPREVVVRVAEELERLGKEDDEVEEEEEELDQDGLPTFAGEAPRIHLGEMKLDGLPPARQLLAESQTPRSVHSRTHSVVGAESGSDNILLLQALLSMLGNLHPRIKTQYPSRFLATSLPAALGAYRRMNITADATSSFIDLLTKLSGKSRPALPPRTSTAGSIPTTAIPLATEPAASVQTAPLPDPEAKGDSSSADTNSQVNEKAITQRLLQAVMLEVLDEFTGSFQTTDEPSMSWSIRLREKHEPQRVMPHRPSATQRWTRLAELQQRDQLVARFIKLSKDLELDVTKEVHDLVQITDGEKETPVEEPETDYPTSPAQIPFPTSGLFLLFAAQNFAQDTTGLTSTSPLSLTATQTMFRATFAPAQELPHPPSLSQTDALISLIYTTLQSPLAYPTTPATTATPATPVAPSSSQTDLPFLTNLTNLFTTSPDPQVRDSAHHLTTLLLHNHTTPTTKLLYIKSLLSPHTSPSPIHEIQQGNLRAVAINWLKDEFLHFEEVKETTTTTVLSPGLLQTDPDLPTLIFPVLPTPPSPLLTSAQPNPSTTTPMNESELELFLLHIPGYIASLNLLCVLSSIPSPSDNTESILAAPHHQQPGETFSSPPLLMTASTFLTTLSGWSEMLLGLTTGIAMRQEQGMDGPINVSDVYALQDAVTRAKGSIEGL